MPRHRNRARHTLVSLVMAAMDLTRSGSSVCVLDSTSGRPALLVCIMREIPARGDIILDRGIELTMFYYLWRGVLA